MKKRIWMANFTLYTGFSVNENKHCHHTRISSDAFHFIFIQNIKNYLSINTNHSFSLKFPNDPKINRIYMRFFFFCFVFVFFLLSLVSKFQKGTSRWMSCNVYIHFNTTNHLNKQKFIRWRKYLQLRLAIEPLSKLCMH